MTTVTRADQKVILYGVSWETYQRLVDEHHGRGTRFTYNAGDLEIKVLSARHERPSRSLEYLVNILAEELDLDVVQVGSTTFQREDLKKGFEPDSSHYFTLARELEGRELDPATDPPPDLIIEVDVTSPSLPRFPIYAAFGVPEIWRYDGKNVAMYRLEGGRYVEMSSSIAIPPLNAEVATRFMEERPKTRNLDWVRQVRQWAREQR